LNCNEPLIQGIKDQDETEKIAIDKARLITERGTLKKCLIAHILSFFLFWSPLLILGFINNKFVSYTFFGLSLIMVITFICTRFLIVFQIKHIYELMHKDKGTISLTQFVAFFLPLGETTYSVIILNESKKAIQDGWILKPRTIKEI